MTEDVRRTEDAKQGSKCTQSHWSIEQIVCHSILQVALFILIMSLLTVGLTQADYQMGMNAYKRGDYKTALEEWQPLAEDGAPKPQFNLGLMYDNGRGVAQNYGEALKWYRKAAEQGYALAQFNLGGMYYEGRGVPQDDKKAVKWYRKAAEQDYTSTQLNLGVMYYNGRGVVQDYGEAIKWYRKAALQGKAPAQRNLGVMYEDGKGIVQNYVTAHMWYNLAGAGGDEKAREYRDRIAEKMTPAQIAEAQRLAREWKPKKMD